MEEENLKYFELNNSVLDDFDKLMSMHLDYVEELKVSEIDPKSKLLNIISLCINIKTIIIEGDQRVNTNNIVSNICKPELLENIELVNVKLPNGYILKKLTGLKKIVLKNIRFSNIGAFFKGIVEPKKIEELYIENSDFEKNSIKLLEDYSSIKKLTLKDVVNCKLEELDLLTRRKKVEEIKFKNLKIDIDEINNLLKGKFSKKIDCKINVKEDYKIKDTFKIDEEGKKIVTLNSSNLDEFIGKVNLTKIDKLCLILENTENIEDYIKPLKKVKGILSVLIKNIAQLNQNEAAKLKQRLKVEVIDVLGIDEYTIESSYTIEDYLVIRNEIENYIKMIPEDISDIEKFLDLYKILSNSFETINEELEDEKQKKLKNELLDKKCQRIEFAKILYNCLSCLKIESNIIYGKLTKQNKDHTWNQVKIEDKWYNIDIALDYTNIKSKNILKRKSKYCLIGDKKFFETHNPISNNKKYAEESFDKKILNVFFKTGIYSDRFFNSYFKSTLDKIKKLTKINAQKALPSAAEQTEGVNNDSTK